MKLTVQHVHTLYVCIHVHAHVHICIYMYMYSVLQVHAGSINEAYKIIKSFPTISEVLVGGKNYRSMEQSDVDNANALTERDTSENTSAVHVGLFVRSIFLPKHGYGGTLYRVGEHCLATHNDEDIVIKISDIFSLCFSGTYYSFFKGGIYLQDTISDQSPRIHTYSSNPILKYTANTGVLLVQQLKRKVMLYPHEEAEKYILIDHQRPAIPLSPSDILIPQYPEPDDMIAVQGDGDIWLAHVQSVNTSAQTCQVYFYIKDVNDNKLFKKESNRLENVHWNSVLEIKEGQWLSNSDWYLGF